MNTRSSSPGWAGVLLLLVLLVGCSGSIDSVDRAAQPLNVVIRCGPDVLIRMNITGDLHVRTEDILGSRCRAEITGGRMTLECPSEPGLRKE